MPKAVSTLWLVLLEFHEFIGFWVICKVVIDGVSLCVECGVECIVEGTSSAFLLIEDRGFLVAYQIRRLLSWILLWDIRLLPEDGLSAIEIQRLNRSPLRLWVLLYHL